MRRKYGSLLWAAIFLSGISMLLMMTISTADVIAYLVIGKPFAGANEIVEIALAVCVVMAIVYAHYVRSHVQVDLISERFGPKTRRVTEILSLLFATACTGLLAYGGWLLALTSLEAREIAITLHSFPIYPWKILFAVGLTLAAIEAFRQLILALLGKVHWTDGEISQTLEEGAE